MIHHFVVRGYLPTYVDVKTTGDIGKPKSKGKILLAVVPILPDLFVMES